MKLLIITGSTKEYFDNQRYISMDYDMPFTKKAITFFYMNYSPGNFFVLKSNSSIHSIYNLQGIKTHLYNSDADLNILLVKALIPASKTILDLSSRFDFTFHSTYERCKPLTSEKDLTNLINRTFGDSAASIKSIKERSKDIQYIKYIISDYYTEKESLDLGYFILEQLDCNEVIIKHGMSSIEQIYLVINRDRTFTKFKDKYSVLNDILVRYKKHKWL